MDFFGPFMLKKIKIYKIARFCEDIYLKNKIYFNMVKVKKTWMILKKFLV